MAGTREAPARSAQERLSAFAGRWKTAGEAHDSPFGPRADVSAIETYAWLPGGRFLIHRLEGRLAADEIACIEVVGYDLASDGYSVHSFYNNGTRNVWRLKDDADTWVLTGAWPLRDQTLHVRCTSRFNDTRNAVTCRWEYSRDGADWQAFWDTRMTRA
jgi:hypothetical protein